MALISSPLRGVQSSISGMRSGLSKSTETVSRIKKVIARRTKIKSDAVFKSKTNFLKRRDATRKRDAEDVLEASNFAKVLSPAFAIGKSIYSSGKGFLGRIISAIGYLAAGWLLMNLPTFIRMAKEFVGRVFRTVELIQNFFGGLANWVGSVFNIVKAYGQNIISLDFFDTSGRVKTAFDQLNDSMNQMQLSVDEAISILTTPLSENIVTEPQGERREEPSTSGTGTGGESDVTGIHKEALDAIAKYESASAGGYNAMNQGTISDPTGQRPYSGDSNNAPGVKKPLTSMTIGEVIQRQSKSVMNNQGFIHAAGRYQFIGNTLPGAMRAAGLKPSDPFSPKNQDLMALALIRSRGAAPWLADPRSRLKSDKKALAAIERARTTPLSTSSSSSTQASTPQGQPRRVSTGRMTLIPQAGPGGFIQGGSGKGGEAVYATHFHLDYKGKNPNDEQLKNIREVAFHAVKAMHARGSKVYFGNLKQYASKNDSKLRSQILLEQRKHGERSSAAVDIQELNSSVKPTFPSQPGSATKFPFAVGSVYYRGGYGREAEIIGSNGITVSHGAAGSSASKVNGMAQPAKVTPTSAPEIVNVIDTRSAGGQTSPSGGSEPSAPTLPFFADESEMLNKFIRQKFITDLSYL